MLVLVPLLLSTSSAAPLGSAGSRWTPTGPSEPMTAVALHPARPTNQAAGAASGEVWVSVDGGASWRSVLSGSADGRPRGGTDDLEAVVQEVLADVDLEALGDVEALESGNAALEDAAAQLAEAVDDRVESGAVVVSEPPTVHRVVFLGQQLFAAREDGLWVGSSDGRVWEHVVHGVAVHDVVRTELGFVAATDDGGRVSGDGRVWLDPVDGSEGIPLTQLYGFDDGALFGASPEGLWRSDGFDWWRVSAESCEALLVHAGPFGDQPTVVLGTADGLRLSRDGGGSSVRHSGPRIPGVSRIVRQSVGHWWMASADGVWQSLDWGVSTEPVSRGLPGPHIADLAVADARALAATPAGLFELRPPPEIARQQGPVGRSLPTPAGFIGTALSRPGVRLPRRSTALARWLPLVNVNARSTTADGLRYDSGLDLDDPVLDASAATQRPFRRDWRVGVELRWSLGGRESAVFGSAAGDVAGAELGVELGSAAPGGRGSGDYERELSTRIVRLVADHDRATHRRAELWSSPLIEQVLVELRVLEIEGELDALTDGGVSEWRTASAEPREAG